MPVVHPHVDSFSLKRGGIARHDMPNGCYGWQIQLRSKAKVKICFHNRRGFEKGKYWTLTEKDSLFKAPEGTILHSLKVFYLADRNVEVECLAFEQGEL